MYEIPYDSLLLQYISLTAEKLETKEEQEKEDQRKTLNFLMNV